MELSREEHLRGIISNYLCVFNFNSWNFKITIIVTIRNVLLETYNRTFNVILRIFDCNY